MRKPIKAASFVHNRAIIASGIILLWTVCTVLLSFAVPPVRFSEKILPLGQCVAFYGVYNKISPYHMFCTSAVPSAGKQTSNKAAKSPQPEICVKKLSSSSTSITNLTNKSVNLQSMLAAPKAFNKSSGVLIVHSHTTESYTPSEKYSFSHSDTYRSNDPRYNMTLIGNRISDILAKKGINVYHATDVCDYPDYNKSYTNSLSVCEEYIAKHPDIKIILDVHRDAVESGGKSVKYITEDGFAPIMFVVGSDQCGLEHKNWQSNLIFALQLQEYICKNKPGIMRPINFRAQRFNQHLAPGAIIVEIGSNTNTFDDALKSAELFADLLVQFLETD